MYSGSENIQASGGLRCRFEFNMVIALGKKLHLDVFNDGGGQNTYLFRCRLVLTSKRSVFQLFSNENSKKSKLMIGKTTTIISDQIHNQTFLFTISTTRQIN